MHIKVFIAFIAITLFLSTTKKVMAEVPIISNGSPVGTIAAGSLQINLSVQTDINATCKYAYNPSTAYDDTNNSYLFTTTGGTTHSKTFNYPPNTTNGQIFIFYVRCKDSNGDVNSDPFVVNFSVDTSSQPTLRQGTPSGALPTGTSQTLLEFFSLEFVSCRLATSPEVAYESMTQHINDYGTYHSITITGLMPGVSYAYYVRCSYPIGNPNTNDFPIIFSVPNSNFFSVSNFTTLISSWMKIVSNNNISDINTDNIVNAKDLGIMMSKWQ